MYLRSKRREKTSWILILKRTKHWVFPKKIFKFISIVNVTPSKRERVRPSGKNSQRNETYFSNDYDKRPTERTMHLKL